MTGFGYNINGFGASAAEAGPSGQQEFTTAGSFTWTAPDDVTAVAVVAMGGNVFWGSGGAMGWANGISVTPGEDYDVTVGSTGGNSVMLGVTARGGGGSANAQTAGGTYSIASPASAGTGSGGGNGGANGTRPGGGIPGCGGQGGYAGAGGTGGNGGSLPSTAPTASTAGSGGASGAGGAGGDVDPGGVSEFGGQGGETGIKGQGSNGAAGATGTNGGVDGGVMRAGHGGAGSDGAVHPGYGSTAIGSVRVMWGSGRAYPSTGTADV